MTFFAWLVLGLAAGLLGNRLIWRSDGGMAIDAALGVIGAVVCGYVGTLVGIGGVSGLDLAQPAQRDRRGDRRAGRRRYLPQRRRRALRPPPPLRLRVVVCLRFDPALDRAVDAGRALPERGAGLEEIHQHFRRGEGFAAMGRRDADIDDLVARLRAGRSDGSTVTPNSGQRASASATTRAISASAMPG